VISVIALALAANVFVDGCSTRANNCFSKQAAFVSRAAFCGTTVAFGLLNQIHPGLETDPNQIEIVHDAAFFTVFASADATLAQLNCLKDPTAPSPLFAAPPIKKKR